MNRKEKINFLTGLINRQRKIHELLPQQIFVFHFIDETQTYQCKKFNLEFTESDLRKYEKLHPEINFIVVVREIISR
jgi:hypothetical protein